MTLTSGRPSGTGVDISAALSADLADLGQDLVATGSDLADSVRLLRRDATLAVRSLLGLTLTVIIRQEPVTLTYIDAWVQPSDIRSSLQIALPRAEQADLARVMTFYAEDKNAFDQLATDLAVELAASDQVQASQERITIRTDTLVPSVLSSGIIGVRELSQVSRAIGVLMARGYDHDSALDYLSERVTSEIDLHQVAVDLLQEVRPT